MSNLVAKIILLLSIGSLILSKNSTGGDFFLKLKKCRFCKKGTTHTLMMFLKYDKKHFNSFDLRLQFTSKSKMRLKRF